MRPTTEESLQCMRRVLANVIMPRLSDGYAIEQAGLQIAALEDLAKSCRDDIPRLMQANDEIILLIGDARTLIDENDPLLVALDGCVSIAEAPTGRYPSFDDLHRRNVVLREGLSKIIIAWPRNDELSTPRCQLRDRILEQLKNHLARCS
jgi:hypothetical protein